MQRPEKGFSKDQKKVLKGRPWTTAQQGEKGFERKTMDSKEKKFLERHKDQGIINNWSSLG
jgi:hypothetical protein